MNHPQQTPPLIAIALMVKNEAGSIQSTLASMLTGGIQHCFILDTGSTDNTIALAEAFFKRHHITGKIQQEPFIDFSASRNRTLELAEQRFPDIPFLLMPDAEWHLHNASVLVDFCEGEQHGHTRLYLVPIKMNATEFATARLFRTASRVRFKGVVHEVPEELPGDRVPRPVFFEVNASSRGLEKSRKRWQQDLQLLSKAYEENPEDPRNTFYLAQTCECLNDLDNAFLYYQHRAKLPGWDEENFVTLYRLGCLATRMKHSDPFTGWAIAMDYFLKAFAMRPHRIEPLVKIAEHYWPDNIQTCYLFIRHAWDIPYPEHDLLFVDLEAYHCTRYEIMSRCAWYMGDYTLGEKATRLALKARPGTEHLLRNLALYQEKLNGHPSNPVTPTCME